MYKILRYYRTIVEPSVIVDILFSLSYIKEEQQSSLFHLGRFLPSVVKGFDCIIMSFFFSKHSIRAGRRRKKKINSHLPFLLVSSWKKILAKSPRRLWPRIPSMSSPSVWEEWSINPVRDWSSYTGSVSLALPASSPCVMISTKEITRSNDIKGGHQIPKLYIYLPIIPLLTLYIPPI